MGGDDDGNHGSLAPTELDKDSDSESGINSDTEIFKVAGPPALQAVAEACAFIWDRRQVRQEVICG